MLDIKLIRENPEEVAARLLKRNFEVNFTELLSWDSERRELRIKMYQMKNERNISAKKVPVFAGEEATCKGCGYATLSISYYNIGKKTGEMAAEILLGKKDISKMAIEYDAAPQKKYNEAACKNLGIDVEALKSAGYTVIAGTEAE